MFHSVINFGLFLGPPLALLYSRASRRLPPALLGGATGGLSFLQARCVYDVTITHIRMHYYVISMSFFAPVAPHFLGSRL